ncbi:shikimate dehydrogenase [Comamonas composti]|uniref:shikimate dehydrogenase n=1 Tax=Comamonas composti TaxID=408558 RepID=UPI000416B4A3|nr:shikimate dehydrogenase [Comamonas composti]
MTAFPEKKDRYCVMGHPVEHSRSPWIHARFAELTSQSMGYERQLVALDGFPQAVQDFAAAGGRGCNVTVPFKHEAAQIATHASERVLLAGAANTLVFSPQGIHADNTDGLGLVADIERNAGLELAGRKLLLIGAGGAAAGALGALIARRPAHIIVVNRSFERARALVERHAHWAAQHQVSLQALELQALPSPFDIVINASASSLAGDPPPVPASVLHATSLAYDMMYGPAAQGFLQWAADHGAQARDGLGMLVEQAAEAFALWRGQRPPSAQVLEELRAQMHGDAA